jgi:pilus assembly protein Flp/PilA
MLHALCSYVTARVTGAQSERGATAVEYGLMLAFIAAVIVVAVGLLGVDVQSLFQRTVDAFP